MTNVIKKHSISSELAQKMMNAAVAKARELGVSENVTILDDGRNERQGSFGDRGFQGDRAGDGPSVGESWRPRSGSLRPLGARRGISRSGDPRRRRLR